MTVSARNRTHGGSMENSKLKFLNASIARILIVLMAAPIVQAAPVPGRAESAGRSGAGARSGSAKCSRGAGSATCGSLITAQQSSVGSAEQQPCRHSCCTCRQTDRCCRFPTCGSCDRASQAAPGAFDCHSCGHHCGCRSGCWDCSGTVAQQLWASVKVIKPLRRFLDQGTWLNT